jgi:hypothetical protein
MRNPARALIPVMQRRPPAPPLVVSRTPATGRQSAHRIGPSDALESKSDDRASRRRPYKMLRTTRTRGCKWAVVTVDALIAHTELPPEAHRYARGIAERLQDACEFLDRLGFPDAMLHLQTRASLPQSVADLFRSAGLAVVDSAEVYVADRQAGTYACAVLMNRRRAGKFFKGITKKDLAFFAEATGLLVIVTDRVQWDSVLQRDIAPVILQGLAEELRPQLVHEVFHGVQRATMPEFYRIRSQTQQQFAWEWLIEGTATAVELDHELGAGARDTFGERLRAALRAVSTERAGIRWRDWSQPIDAWDNVDFPQYAVGAMFAAAEDGDLGYLPILLRRLNTALEGRSDFPANRYAFVHDALLRRGLVPDLVPRFVVAAPTRGPRPTVRGLAAVYARAIATCGRYDPEVADAHNAEVNRGSLDGFRWRIDASSVRDVRGEALDVPVYNMSTDGRAYHYTGGGLPAGVRITLGAQWNPNLYVLVGESTAKHFPLVLANTPGAVIELPWVPTEREPLVVSIMHIDVLGGPVAPPLSWQYVVETL